MRLFLLLVVSRPVGDNGDAMHRASRAQAASAFNNLDKVDVSVFLLHCQLVSQTRQGSSRIVDVRRDVFAHVLS